MNSFQLLQHNLVDTGKSQLSESVKLLLYKNDPDIFEKLDFERERIYCDPLFCAYFNSKEKNESDLSSIIFGYSDGNLYSEIDLESDEFGRIHLAGKGWIATAFKNQIFKLQQSKNKLRLFKEGNEIDYNMETCLIIDGTNIELLTYPIPLLKQYYYNKESKIIDVEIQESAKKHLGNLTKAYGLIKKHLPHHYDLIQNAAPKCVIFNIDSSERNSFADPAVQGVGFYNAYQEDYNEVFFVDDIAHQTGHAIFYLMLHDVQEILKKEVEVRLKDVNMTDNEKDDRTIYIWFHALYTYYTTFICLDACLENDVFEDPKKKHEALGRVAFYLKKCSHDLNLFSSGGPEIFTSIGLQIYQEILKKYLEMNNKWENLVFEFDLSNQPYNFTYSKFLELNPVKEETVS
ncbi:hypothetical protein FEDK69T_09530 [Flavobacterium enshiense DK69]|uniref:HEXXH motif domain-containing protein n=1 Tax=Flavobacterium enshiense DK69 TaxID=1107311 RepID=V6SJ94_9FLAO|nr:hypothetical protein [Flavobacterium enshiense]ESU24505.1 hypothetical protein FEDK69T_09530 [Flavobacterium enshiense DK69]KGO93842.1 hypothetical protein Q767_14290 [Flavobacterium enshiense DK69]